MDAQQLGQTDLFVTPIGLGAFKIGRNVGTKYPAGYELPDDDEVARFLNSVLDLGINLIDTAPAYGLSEERIGRSLAGRRDEYILSTKVGETFADGQSSFDFSEAGVRASIARSMRALHTDCLDIVYVHSDGNDLDILQSTDVIETLVDLKECEVIRAIGFSSKTIEGAQAAIPHVDVLMLPFNLEDQSHAIVIEQARTAGVGVVAKKGLASGHLNPSDAVQFVLKQPGVSSLVIGSLSVDHLREAISVANQVATTASG